LRLVEAGRLDLDQSLAVWLPELADRQVLRGPTAELDDTVPARRAITLRHLLTNTCGYGMVIQASPLEQAMARTALRPARSHRRWALTSGCVA
jgi:CubicO group peptidase (beta-lactamase class C family)